ncbi:MAG: sensor histidine kinase [Caldilineaceae bacterium]|nr:sensor histidine kinase [Caldilineaceae bacterium]
MTGLKEVVRLGIVGATSTDLAQIQKWTAAFRKRAVRIEAVSQKSLSQTSPEGEDLACDLYLVMVAEGANRATELGALIAQRGLVPCLVLAARDDEALVDAALAAGAVDFLVWEGLNATQLERAVQFALRHRDVLAAITARESYLVAAREREQLQLANALHDGPLQDLIGARFLLGALTSGASVDEIQNNLQAVIQEVRSLCSELKPPALGPFGLEKAIRAHMQGVHLRDPDTGVTLALDVDAHQLPEWARLALFRIFQAALSNVDRHAQATQIWVRLRMVDGQVLMTVADDGQGFEVPDSWLDFALLERWGLLMMQERADALSGRLVVQSTPGSGTRVMVQVPLQQPPVPMPKSLAFTTPHKSAPDEAADQKRVERI